MIQLVHWFLLLFFGSLSYSIPELVRRVFAFIGVSMVTISGVNFIESLLVTKFTGLLSDLPYSVMQILGLMHIDDAFSMIISAFAIKRVLSGWDSSGKKSKLTIGKDGVSDTPDPWSGGPPKTGGYF